MKNINEEEFNKLTRRSGISLIVLVITIIVILILATAIIISLNNNNPIIEAREANNRNNKSTEKELIGLAIMSCKIEERDNILQMKKLQEKLKVEFGENNCELLLNGKDIIINIKNSGNQYIIKNDGTLEEKESKKIVGIEDVNVGDYVKYNIEYNNVSSVQEDLKTWRILSKGKENGEEFAKIITTGVPLCMEIDSTSGEIRSVFDFAYICGDRAGELHIKECEFVNEEAKKIEYVSDLKELFRTNSFTSKNADGTPKVEILNKTIVEEVLQMSVSESVSVIDNDLLAINNGSEFAKIIIPDVSGNNERWCIDGNADFKLLQDVGVYGIIPIVSLKTNVKFIESDKKINGNVVYDLIIEYDEEVLPEYYVKFAEYENFSVGRGKTNTLNLITTQNIEEIKVYNKAGREEKDAKISYIDKGNLREWEIIHVMTSAGTSKYSLECYNKDDEIVQTITRFVVHVKRVV